MTIDKTFNINNVSVGNARKPEVIDALTQLEMSLCELEEVLSKLFAKTEPVRVPIGPFDPLPTEPSIVPLATRIMASNTKIKQLIRDVGATIDSLGI